MPSFKRISKNVNPVIFNYNTKQEKFHTKKKGKRAEKNTIRSESRTVFFVVGLGGLEPPTSRLSGVRSNQLSYRPMS